MFPKPSRACAIVFAGLLAGTSAHAAMVVKADPTKKILTLKLSKKEKAALGSKKDVTVNLPDGSTKLPGTVKLLHGYRLVLNMGEADLTDLTAKSKVTLEFAAAAATTEEAPESAEGTATTDAEATPDAAATTAAPKKGAKAAAKAAAGFDNPFFSIFSMGDDVATLSMGPSQFYQTKKPTVDPFFIYASKSTSSETDVQGNYNDTKGMLLGAMYRHPLASKPELVLGAGLAYSKENITLSTETADTKTSGKATATYLGVPMGLSYTLSQNMAAAAEILVSQFKISGDGFKGESQTHQQFSLGFTYFTPTLEVANEYLSSVKAKDNDIGIPGAWHTQAQFKLTPAINFVTRLGYIFHKDAYEDEKNSIALKVGGEYVFPALMKMSAAFGYETESSGSAETASPTTLPYISVDLGAEWLSLKTTVIGGKFTYKKTMAGKRTDPAGDADLAAQESDIALYGSLRF